MWASSSASALTCPQPAHEAQAAEIEMLKDRIEELRHDRSVMATWLESAQRLLPAPSKRKKGGKD